MIFKTRKLFSFQSFQYLGAHTTEKVKKKCIEIMYSWTLGLKHESKIVEAYSMLKRQGIVKEDPTYVEQVDILFTLRLG